MFYPASFHRQLDLAAAVVVESVSESAAAAEQKDDPQAVTSAAKTASSVSSAAAAAAEQKDIHRQELPPNPEEDSHPHPQFVALKSLIIEPPYNLFTLHNM